MIESQNELDQFVEFANRLADIARATAQVEFNASLSFVEKHDGTPVTPVDEAIERLLVAAIKEEYPSHGLLGEETGVERLDNEYVWVIDPIDGTKSFITGTPTFGTLIALCRNGIPVLGVMDLPVMSQRYVGAVDRPTLFNGEEVKPGTRNGLDECVMSTSGVEFFKGAAPRSGFDNLVEATNWNVYGAGCGGYGALARGLVDICLEGANLSTFDYCALVPIVTGAGGKITDWNGDELRLVGDMSHRASGVIATADANIHALALKLLQN